MKATASIEGSVHYDNNNGQMRIDVRITSCVHESLPIPGIAKPQSGMFP